MFFAELGAQVIKVEPLTGDVTRSWRIREEVDPDQLSSYFTSVNWGKRSLALDISVKAGQDLLYQLLSDTDVLISNFRPASAQRLGLAYHQLCDSFPRLIYGSVSGYGATQDRAGYDAVIQAESGFMYLNREPEAAPQKMPVALMDLLAAHQLKTGLLAALYHRLRTGQGDHIHVSLLDAAVSALANQASSWLWSGTAPEPMGSEHPAIAPYGSVFSTQDHAQVLIAVGNDRQFRELCRLSGVPELGEQPHFRSNPDRVRHRERLGGLLSEAIAQLSSDEWLPQLISAGIPAGRICTPAEVLEDINLRHLLLGQLRGATLERGLRTAVFTSVNHAYHRSALNAPPVLGADTWNILFNDLKLDSTGIDALHQQGTIVLAGTATE